MKKASRWFGTRCVGALMLIQGTGLALAQEPVQIGFKSSTFAAVENATYVTIELYAWSGSYQPDPITVQYATHEGTAKAGQDYVTATGELVITPNDSNNTFQVEILNDSIFEGTEWFQVSLVGLTGNGVFDGATNAVVEIVDDEAYVPGVLDAEFDTSDGPDAAVNAVAPARNGKVLAGGAFTNVTGLARPALARLKKDGAVDPSFQSPLEAGSVVYAVLEQSDGKVVAGGSLLVGGEARSVVRVEANGNLDTGFAPPSFTGPVYALAAAGIGKTLVGGSFVTGGGDVRSNLVCVLDNGGLDSGFTTVIDGSVRAILVEPDGKVLIAGSFQNVQGQPRRLVARLLENGSLDTNYTSGGGGVDGPMAYALARQNDGKVIVSGAISGWNGWSAPSLLRLSTDGIKDYDYTAGVENDGAVRALAMQPNGRLILGGNITGIYNMAYPGSMRSRQGLGRMTLDGFPDPSFDPEGAYPTDVRAVALQMEDMKVLVAGDFTTFNSQPRKRICRLHGDIRTRITGVEVAGQVVSLTVTNEAQRAYVLERSETGSDWVAVTTNVPMAQQCTFTNVVSPWQKSGFFRVKEVNPS